MMGKLVGALTALVALAILAGPSTASALDVYATDFSANGVIYQLTGAPNGELLPKQPAKVQSGGQYPGSLVLSRDGRSLYAVNYSGNVGQFSVRADGTLVPKVPPTAPTGDRPQSIALSRTATTPTSRMADGRRSRSSGSTTTGGWSRRPRFRAARIPSGIAISPDGQYAYVTNYHSRTISQFVITRSGKLVLNDPPVVGAAEFPRAIVASPAGSVYVVNEYSDVIGQYTIGPGGGLVPKTPTLVGTGQRPSAIAITPDGKNAYVSNLGRPGGVSQYSVDSGGGLFAKSPAIVSSSVASPGSRPAPPARASSPPTSPSSYRGSGPGDGGGLTLGQRTQIGPYPQGDRRPRLHLGPPVGPTARENPTQPGAWHRQADRHRRPRRAAEAGRRRRRASPQAMRAPRLIRCAGDPPPRVEAARAPPAGLGRCAGDGRAQPQTGRAEPTQPRRQAALGRRLTLPGAEFAQRTRMSRLSRSAVGPRRSSP